MSLNLSEFIIKRLVNVGVRTIFGVPGDFVMHFMDRIIASPDLTFVPCCNELNASYAADAYARTSVNGVGCLCVTTGVGSMSALNGVAMSYAEHVPVVVISGTPFIQDTEKARSGRILLHHTTGTDTSMSWEASVYSNVTCDVVSLSTSPLENCLHLDSAFQRCVRERRPIFIQIPVDLAVMPLPAPMVNPERLLDRNFRQEVTEIERTGGNADQLEQAVQWIVKRVMERGNGVGKQAMIGEQGGVMAVLGVEFQRYYEPDDDVRIDFAELVQKAEIPFVTTPMGRCVLSEESGLFVGPFNGEKDDCFHIGQAVSSAGVVLSLGGKMIDVDMTSLQNSENWVWIGDNMVQCAGEALFKDVPMKRVLKRLSTVLPLVMKKGGKTMPEGVGVHSKRAIERRLEKGREEKKKVAAAPGDYEKVMDGTNAMDAMMTRVPENTIVVCDTGDVYFRLDGYRLPRGSQFVSNAFYKSIGYSLPAGVGVTFAEKDRVALLKMPKDKWFVATCTQEHEQPQQKDQQQQQRLSVSPSPDTSANPSPMTTASPSSTSSPSSSLPSDSVALLLSQSPVPAPVLVVTGDGALQMTIQEMSTMLRHSCQMCVFIWNNREYLIEKALHKEGLIYNDLHSWRYAEGGRFFCATDSANEHTQSSSKQMSESQAEPYDVIETVDKNGETANYFTPSGHKVSWQASPSSSGEFETLHLPAPRFLHHHRAFLDHLLKHHPLHPPCDALNSPVLSTGSASSSSTSSSSSNSSVASDSSSAIRQKPLVQSCRVEVLDDLEHAISVIFGKRTESAANVQLRGPSIIEVSLSSHDMDPRLKEWGKMIHSKMDRMQQNICDLVMKRNGLMSLEQKDEGRTVVAEPGVIIDEEKIRRAQKGQNELGGMVGSSTEVHPPHEKPTESPSPSRKRDADAEAKGIFYPY
ncbi:putative Thiamine pyrophosphate TPP binding domain-containing protein [Monocercomonoides exilis]|uniref:putative Thiamine pyrophosphate TPP binding domain-containing protein n=1 Tax=Monocercomonoides exilis TaxID=2049356 RepID=UPI00355A262D|nr:putative Thiamine pyrophosphate TPP binding domain-containing protein [Monocercomonoides exilis]|eukprot:MONOS_1987.1-p1 / transcript=MONOS_1987.1 / gene=MONOS_1987 / organism=Monocercomonoides_exilis_PA203 / gene_product=Thiamine pyrophosphate TPP binding domain-containing protein / transcript_product=Thiamine pyrophosphate TPP binding domain-containing protein / location=Mono_scaffold00038:74294-77409(-) / protein_length=918 / sequence_SO=supercontig / SO=protein_coding / is_pseudo=false